MRRQPPQPPLPPHLRAQQRRWSETYGGTPPESQHVAAAPPPAAAAPSSHLGGVHHRENFSDDADVNDNNSDVGFESDTVLLFSSSSQPSATGNTGGVRNSVESTNNNSSAPSSLRYTHYEPAYAQQQPQQVVGGVLPYPTPEQANGVVSNWSGATRNSILPLPDMPPAMPGYYPGANAAPSILPPPDLHGGVLDYGAAPIGSNNAVFSGPYPYAGMAPTAPPPTYTTAPPPQQQQQPPHAREVLDVPLHAPRLRVPTDLPLEQTILLDLLAMAVVQGGPTTEEEIAKREVGRANPAFAFLGEKFNHPCQLYYRWRLYALLQGDTLLEWRTQPFQMEDARRAYVWVPPPALQVGPACLAALHRPELLDADSDGAAALGDAANANAGEGSNGGATLAGEIVRQRRRRHRRRGDTKRHRHEAPEKRGGGDNGNNNIMGDDEHHRALEETAGHHRRSSSVSSSGSSSSSSGSSIYSSDSVGGRGHPSRGKAAEASPPATAAEKEGPAVNGVASRSGVAAAEGNSRTTTTPLPRKAAAVRLPPPSAQWVSRQCILHHHVFGVLHRLLLDQWTALLNPYAIAEPSAGTTADSQSGSNQLLSVYAAWLRREEIAQRMVFAVQHADAIHHLLSVLLDAVVRVAYEATARSREARPGSTDSNVYCVEALWYLFILHDIAMNAAHIPEAAAGCASSATQPSCSNRNAAVGGRGGSSSGAASVAAGGRSGSLNDDAGEEDEGNAFEGEGNRDTLEALYETWQQCQHRSAHSTAPATPPSPHASLAPPDRPRHRRRNPQRRSPYERCGDAMELILPTLIEACAAIALAVSMDKERERSLATAAAAARTRHLRVLNPLQQQRQELKSKAKGKSADHDVAAAAAAASLLSASGGPSLSLNLDAGDDSGTPTTAPPTATAAERASDARGAARDGEEKPHPDAAAPSSAPAVLLLLWLKTLLVVWMNVEQPSLPTHHAASSIQEFAPPDTVWPNCCDNAADMAEVKLHYHLEQPYARVLDRDAAAQRQEQRHYAPLLSARGCAILKDRYEFLFSG